MKRKITALIIGNLIVENINHYVASARGDEFVFPVKKKHPLNLNDKVNLTILSTPKRGIIELLSVDAGNKRYYSAKYHD